MLLNTRKTSTKTDRKLDVCRVDKESLYFLRSYVRNGKNGPKSRHHIVNLVQYIHIWEMLYESRDLDIATYTNDNTLYKCS